MFDGCIERCFCFSQKAGQTVAHYNKRKECRRLLLSHAQPMFASKLLSTLLSMCLTYNNIPRLAAFKWSTHFSSPWSLPSQHLRTVQSSPPASVSRSILYSIHSYIIILTRHIRSINLNNLANQLFIGIWHRYGCWLHFSKIKTLKWDASAPLDPPIEVGESLRRSSQASHLTKIIHLRLARCSHFLSRPV